MAPCTLVHNIHPILKKMESIREITVWRGEQICNKLEINNLSKAFIKGGLCRNIAERDARLKCRILNKLLEPNLNLGRIH